MQPLHFGSTDQPIFGVFHRGMGNPTGPSRAVVLCPPMGQEYIRTHWTLRLAASQLARKGIHVLRFDYRGMGDSGGTTEQIMELSDWENDVEMAVDKLRELSGAQKVCLLGMRFGASIASNVAWKRPDLIHSTVHWEPIASHSAYLDELRAMHARMLDLWVCRMETICDDSREEILGSLFSRTLLNQIESLEPMISKLIQPQMIFELQSHPCRFEMEHPFGVKLVSTEDEYTWNLLGQLETALLRTRTLREVVVGVVDLFKRLQRFGLLETDTDVTAEAFAENESASYA